MTRSLIHVLAAFALAASAFARDAHAATSQWKPEQAIELVVGTAPGSGPDKNARIMQKIFQEGKFFAVPVVVVNKPGAGSTVSGAYVHKFEGKGHYVLMSGKALISSDVMGRLSFPYTELTPITHTMDEYIGIAVKADSPIKSGRDLLDRLQKDPTAHSVAIATSLGNANHQAVAAAMKAAGIDPRKARNVVFNSGGAAITALLGGHVDIVPESRRYQRFFLDSGLRRNDDYWLIALRSSPVTREPSAIMNAMSLFVVMKRAPLRMNSV